MKYLKLFTNFGGAISSLEEDEVGRLFRAMLKYAEDGTEPELIGNERHVWGAAKLHMDMARDFSNTKSAAGAIGGQASASKRKQTQANASTVKLKEKKGKESNKEILSYESKERTFVPPTVDEVRAYCEERHNGIDPERFVSSYERKGWVVGKTRMKDWKAAVRYWETFREQKSQYTNADLERFEVKL